MKGRLGACVRFMAGAVRFVSPLVVSACGLSCHSAAGSEGADARANGDSGAPTSGDPNAPTESVRLTGPIGEWTWYDIPGTECGNGAQTGLAVNMGTGSDLFIFLEGGGACFNQPTCTGIATGLMDVEVAKYFNSGFTATEFWASVNHTDAPIEFPNRGGIFDRTVMNHPFKNSSWVYIPYCTGDVHSGNTVEPWSDGRAGHYKGVNNLLSDLSVIVPSFPAASRVTLAGRSAGAFGAELNLWRVREAFGNKRVDLVADSFPLFRTLEHNEIAIGLNHWKARENFPASCAECQDNIEAFYAFNATNSADSRRALLSNSRDKLVSLVNLSPAPVFHDLLNGLTHGTLQHLPNTGYFVQDSNEHTLLKDLSAQSYKKAVERCVKGVCTYEDVYITLGEWLTSMTTDSSSWTNFDMTESAAALARSR